MGQCCGKCKETPEVVTVVRESQEVGRPSLTPLIASDESPDAQDVAPAPPAKPQDEPQPEPPPEPSAKSASLSPPPAMEDEEPLPSPPKGDYLDFPILQDMKTIKYVQKSKVIVIMKGLPGSGKSFLSTQLKKMYKGGVICSADHYFMKDGEYKFNADELKSAHEFCQENARKAAVNGTPVIIIDNTNIQAWNYKSYLRLSKEHHYTPLILEPQTPWAKNTKLLAKKNSHGVPKETLDQRLKKFEPALPLYYWWFLNEDDSSQILTMAQDWLKKSLQVQEFFNDFCDFSKLSSVEEMMRYYKRNEGPGGYKVLHATAFVAKKGKAKNAKEYMAKDVVQDSMGKTFPLHIIGFVLTPRTYGVRLRLGEEALELWGMDDHEVELGDTGSAPAAGQQPAKDQVSLGDTNLKRGSCRSTLRTGESQLHRSRFHPTSDRGSRAHLTLGCAPQVHAKVTGFDLMKVVFFEQKVVKKEDPEESSEMFESFSIPEGELRTYGDSIWVIYPEKEILVSSLFSAFY